MVEASDPVRAGEVDRLRRTIDGEIITPRDPAYDDARRLWNARHDRRPAVIVRPRNAAEVATAIRFGRDLGLDVAVKSGGHSAAGHSTCDGGLVIDLSAMRGVEVNGTTRTARANGGALLGELDVAAQARGLVCPIGVIGHTGVAGLTLGGGVGRLQRNFGLTIDHLTAVELITADGRLVRASETEEPELFWGIRGAGWNFGIVTAFEFRLEPFGPALQRGLSIYAAADAAEAWATFRDYADRAPNSVSCIFGLDRAGDEDGTSEDLAGQPIAYIAYNHSGAAANAERDTAGLRHGPTPLVTTAGSQAYLDVQGAHDLVYDWGHRSYFVGFNADDVRPEVLLEVLDLVADAPGRSSFSVTALRGAISRVDEDATAYAGRSAAFDFSTDAAWDDPALDEANYDWVRQVVSAVESSATLGRYANGSGDTGPEVTRLIYGDAKLARLARLKRAWDPDNVFHLNHNVAPG